MGTEEEDISEVVDEIVDDMDPTRITREAEMLGIKEDELLRRVNNEMKARIGEKH